MAERGDFLPKERWYDFRTREDEERIIRLRAERLAAGADYLASMGHGDGLSCLVETFADSSYPTAAKAFFAVRPVEVDGDQGEGDSPRFVVDLERSFYACNIGSSVPPPGAIVVAHEYSGRWVFNYNDCGA
jgi:hypothetical protein